MIIILHHKVNMLTIVFRVLINNLFYKCFDTVFRRNEKNYQNINYFWVMLMSALRTLVNNSF